MLYWVSTNLMNSTPATRVTSFYLLLTQYMPTLRSLFAGCLLPLSFAPFHFPGLAILGLALLFNQILQSPNFKTAVWYGFVFGAGYMGLGVSWVYVSIHLYGHLHALVAALITCVFIAYLACFFAFFAGLAHFLKYASNRLAHPMLALTQGLVLSAVWCLIEFFRSVCFSGFPWLLLGFGQIDTPLGYELPWIGLYGVGFVTCFTATCLVWATREKRVKLGWLCIFIALMLTPKWLKETSSPITNTQAISVGVIQANLSMRDKWDESLFWNLLEHYQQRIERLLGQTNLVVLPESAIPVPASYLNDWLPDLNRRASQANTALLMGIPKPTSRAEVYYYNTLSALGQAEGIYLKQHLVPFGEYTPKPFRTLMTWLDIPETTMKAGRRNQALIRVQQHSIAALICYELAYPHLLRQQMPQAEWIVSVSDDGWFGHSLAMYQQIQMAQALSILTNRYQVVANNDGLSSIIDPQGQIINTLPAFTSGVLEGKIYPIKTQTPWIKWGDQPILIFSLVIVLIALFSKRRYPYQPTKL